MILISSNKEKLEVVANKLNQNFYVCDLTDPKQIESMIKDIKNKYEQIDCLINCAGIWISGEVSQMENDEFKEMNELNRIKRVIDTNLFSMIAMIKSIFPIMKKQGYGQIININSQSGVITETPYPIYNATKVGAYAFRKAIQNDLTKNNIRITDICPGLINTDFYKNSNDELPEEIMNLGLNVDDVAKTVKYVFDLPYNITMPSIEIKSIKEY